MNTRSLIGLSLIPTIAVSTLISGIPQNEAIEGYWLDGEYFTEGDFIIISATIHTAIPESRPYIYVFASLTNFDEEGYESVACTFRQTDELNQNNDNDATIYNYQGQTYLPIATGAASGVGSSDFVEDGIWELNSFEQENSVDEKSFTC